MSSFIRILEHIFGTDFVHSLLATESLDLQCGKLSPLYLALNKHLPSLIDFDHAKQQASFHGSEVDHRDGLVGNENVRLDLLKEPNRISSYDSLKVIGISHFDTAKSNCGVFKGKWQYEVLLLSSGVMQIGWAAFRSTFGSGQGVGDTSYSYAFDGCRVCKWNIVAESYGEKWDEDDVIGCCIDLDEGLIEFFRNGASLGVAFRNIVMGSGFVYFPTISLQQREGMIINFGSTPFYYPVSNYNPIQRCPHKELDLVTHLLSCLSKLLPLMDSRAAVVDISRDGLTVCSHDAMILELGNILVSHINPHLKNPYVIDSKFIPFIRSLCDPVVPLTSQSQVRPSARIAASKGTHTWFVNNKKLSNCLDLFWMFSEKNDLKQWTNLLVSRLSSKFQHVQRPQVLEFSQQKDAILVLHSFMHHKNFRHFLMSHVLFEGMNLPLLMTIKVPSFEANPFWETEPSVQINKRTFMSSVNRFSLAMNNLEELQIDLLLTMMDNGQGDSKNSPCPRKIFLDKFRALRKQFYAIDRVDALKTPGSPLLLIQPFLLRLLAAFKILWSKEMESSVPIVIPSIRFFDGSINYYDMDRLGGVLLYLLKTYRNDLQQRLEVSQTTHMISNERNSPHQSFTESTTSTVQNHTNELVDLSSRVFDIFDDIASIETWSDQQDSSMSSAHQTLHTSSSEVTQNFLFEVLDSLVLFYHISSKANSLNHKINLVQKKIRTLAQLSCEYKEAVNGLKATYGGKQQSEVLKTLEQSNNCLLEHLQRATSHLVTLYALHYPSRLSMLFKIILNTMKASADDIYLFNFVPEFYLDCLVDILKDLKSYPASTSLPEEDFPERDFLIQEIVQFFCDHINDQRVRVARARDTLLFSLLDIVSSSSLLEVLHHVPPGSQLNMIRFLLQPYENRAWANSNWILVRIWHGSPSCFACGGHWSMYHRNKLRPKPLSYPINPLSFERDPSPSPILQEHIQKLLVDEPNTACGFINSVLNQLNWTFSEFIEMLQQLQNASSGQDQVLVESRQLKICATCFDLTLALLRVLEMVATLAAPVFFRQDHPNFLLARVFQLLCQIMNRVSSQDGCFHHITTLEIPGLENIFHLPILTSVCGILLGILKEDIDNYDKGLSNASIPNATKTLLLEPSFQLSSINFLLEDNPHLYSLKFYKDCITERDICMVQRLLDMVNHYHHTLEDSSTVSNPIDEDEVCTICFALPISVSFEPCHHSSCQACITHHLMNSTDCFFCKTIIMKVFDETGRVLYNAVQETPS